MDPWLEPFQEALKRRYNKAQQWIKNINESEGGLEKFSRGYETLGLQVQENGDITYKEWAPNALRAYLIGDFSKEPIRSKSRTILMRIDQTAGTGIQRP